MGIRSCVSREGKTKEEVRKTKKREIFAPSLDFALSLLFLDYIVSLFRYGRLQMASPYQGCGSHVILLNRLFWYKAQKSLILGCQVFMWIFEDS